MLLQEHTHTAQDFLQEADREFAEGRTQEASAKLWSAATHAVMSMAQQRGWQFATHYDLKMAKMAVKHLADEYDDPMIAGGFLAAEMFHANFYYGFMEDFQIDADCPIVHRFVERINALME